MSFLDQVTTGIQTAPLRLVLYGQEGVGKTTFAASAHHPQRQALLVDLEKGSHAVDVPRLTLDTYPQFIDFLDEVQKSQSFPFKTLIIDSVDWLEDKMIEEICRRGKKKSLADFDWGKGTAALKKETEGLLKRLEQVRLGKGLDLIILGHSQHRTVSDPIEGSFDRYELKLEKKTTPLWKEWSDVLIFARFSLHVTREGNQTSAQGGERIMHFTHQASYDAKCRVPAGFQVPETLPLSYQTFRQMWEAAYNKEQGK